MPPGQRGILDYTISIWFSYCYQVQAWIACHTTDQWIKRSVVSARNSDFIWEEANQEDGGLVFQTTILPELEVRHGRRTHSLWKVSVNYTLPAVIHSWAWLGCFLWAKQRYFSLIFLPGRMKRSWKWAIIYTYAYRQHPFSNELLVEYKYFSLFRYLLSLSQISLPS